MKYTILGAGALGSILAAHLHRAGHTVNLIARGNRLGYLKKNGVQLTGLEEFNVHCQLVEDPARITDTDVLILTPKTYQHKLALEQISHIKANNVFSVTNGVQKTEQIESYFTTSRTLGCMADLK